MKTNQRFNTMAVAMAAAFSPVNGLNAFLAWVLSYGMQKFFLLKTYTGMTYWVREDNGCWLAEDGVRLVKNATSDKILETAYANAFSELDGKKTSYYVPGGEAGWLSPEGVFWSTNYGGHWGLARFVLHRGYDEIEREGWLHVDDAPIKGCWTWRKACGEPTPEQLVWLVSSGHDIDLYNAKVAARRAEEANTLRIGEYTIDKDADAAAFARMMARAPKR